MVGGGWGGWWGLHSHFHVQPNYSVEVVLLVVLCCCWGCDNKGAFKCTSTIGVANVFFVDIDVVFVLVVVNSDTYL